MEAQLLLQIDADPDPAFVTLARHRMVEALRASRLQRPDEAIEDFAAVMRMAPGCLHGQPRAAFRGRS